jgi:hypothetical protein
MIKQILTMLNGLDHYGRSETIEIAKGKFELPTTIKKGWNQIKRNYKWQRISK